MIDRKCKYIFFKITACEILKKGYYMNKKKFKLSTEGFLEPYIFTEA